MQIRIAKNIKLIPVRILAIGFAIVIFIGAVLLSLPISSADGKGTAFIDSLFTSTSAVCVTGLVTLDTGTHWSYFGKTVILLLIEIGGLGFMSFAALIALILGRKITLSERLIMQEAINSSNLQGIVKMVKYILGFTFSVQFMGALLLSTQFIPIYGLGKGIYYSIFHSISAFCNAGFDLMGNFTSLTSFSENSVVILTIAVLIIVGGLGFSVWTEIYNYKNIKKLSLHTKIVIITTAALLSAGWILMMLLEFNNPDTLGTMSLKGKLVNSLFASVTPRTAGFNSISTSDMTMSGRFLTTILMFIGGSSGSTAGGIKTTTFSIIVLSIIAAIKGKDDTEIFQKRIAGDIVRKSFVITTLASTLIVVVTMLLSISEVGQSFEYIFYEVTSAFGTVGLSLGLTTRLSSIGKAILIFTMYSGRLGPLTVALAFTKIKRNNQIRYPEDKILVG
ncbi:trk system potassium uptake protein TrkH [Clostridium pascui]|uniref:TrkH family potassium uptake protein n=1 Tax=Clostridium pascui TaxID=46609 RepID=UPI00195CF09F|nr:TrkH family potassium uptake protein [Clostridium pascui]MBM7868581.1 trk system potassium uptake protein TrkH [Clostridium pascui]